MRAPLRERLATAWHTLTDAEQSELLVKGPLPLWMQNAFEMEAERRGKPVGAVIYDALDDAARNLIEEALRARATMKREAPTRNV